MEYQIRYYWTGMGRGTFSANEQTLQLRGYSAARTRLRIWFIFFAILFGLPPIVSDQKFILINIEAFLGLPHVWWASLISLGSVLAAFYAVLSWPASTIHEEFEKRFVTRLGGSGREVSFDVPNPFKPGKFLHVKFRAKSIEEAEQIEQALSISKAEVAPEGREVSISPDVKGQEIARAISIAPDVEKDIISGRFSKRDIMVKYAIPAKELEEMYKMLSEKP
jgi:hypothetical protein